MSNKLTEFLKAHKTAKKGEFTHTRIGDKDLKITAGSYCINDRDTDEFYTKYYESVFVDKKEEYLTEKQIPEGQMLVDLDFRYSYETTERQHNSEDINKIIYSYLEIFKEFLIPDATMFNIYVFEKPNINRLKDQTLTKDGVHLIFGLNVPFEVQLLIRNRIMETIPELLELPLINNWTSVFDEGISKGTTNWTLYGSRKPKNEAYELKNVYKVQYDLTDNEVMIDEDLDFEVDENTFKMLSCRYSNIPKFSLKDNLKTINDNKKTKKSKKQEDSIMDKLEIMDKLKNNKSLQSITEYANILDIKYIDNYGCWLRIIWGLKSFAKNAEDLKTLYHIALDITRRSQYFQDEEYFKSKWEAFDESKSISIGSFYYYAKCSNEDEYLKIKRTENDNLILKAINDPSDRDLATCFNAIFGDDFIIYGDQLYYYNGIFWEQDKTALKRYVMRQFRNVFIDYIQNLYTESKNIDKLENPEAFANMEQRIKKVNAVKDILGSIYRVKQICETCELDIIENSKDIQLEMNPNIFCFKNKVFDLEKNKFVEPYKYDYMTLQTGYNYREPTAEETKEVITMLNQIFPIEEERTLYLILLSIGMSGYFLEKFVIANGSGGNGKGMLNEFFMNTIGHYGYLCNNAVLLSPIKDGANQTLANLNNKRFSVCREPKENANVKLDDSVIKELTGGGELNARGIYSSNTKVILRALWILEANKVPKISGETDNALMRRIIDIYFRAKFVSNEEDVDIKNYVYLADANKKTDVWKEKHRYALFNILTSYYQMWLKGNKNIDKFIPESVKERTQEYLKNSNELFCWFDENYEKANEAELELVKISDVYKYFTQSDIYTNYTKKEKRAMNLKEFTKQLIGNIFLSKHYKDRLQSKKYLEKYKTTEIKSVILNYKLIVKDNNDICLLKSVVKFTTEQFTTNYNDNEVEELDF
jgi:phage/plasmid-associated DNA primase